VGDNELADNELGDDELGGDKIGADDESKVYACVIESELPGISTKFYMLFPVY